MGTVGSTWCQITQANNDSHHLCPSDHALLQPVVDRITNGAYCESPNCSPHHKTKHKAAWALRVVINDPAVRQRFSSVIADNLFGPKYPGVGQEVFTDTGWVLCGCCATLVYAFFERSQAGMMAQTDLEAHGGRFATMPYYDTPDAELAAIGQECRAMTLRLLSHFQNDEDESPLDGFTAAGMVELTREDAEALERGDVTVVSRIIAQQIAKQLRKRSGRPFPGSQRLN